MMATMKQWVSDGIRSSGWLLWAPLVAAYAPRGLPNMYFNMHIRRYARRLVPFLDPFVTIDIVSMSSEPGQRSDAYKEVKAYLTKVCSRDVLAFRAEVTVEGRSFLLSLREGQEVTDHFHGVTVWWLLAQESCLRLMFPQRHWELILDEYLPHVRRTGREDMFVTIDIAEKPPSPMLPGDLNFSNAFEEVKAYLSSACSRDALNLCAEGTVKDDSFLLSLRDGEGVADRFGDVTLWWLSKRTSSSSIMPQQNFLNQESSCLRLMFPQQHRVLILDEYLPHVRRQGRNIIFGKRKQRLYTNDGNSLGDFGNPWRHIDFEHPATFDTLAMHPNKKRRIIEDLNNFRTNKDYFRRIGKPWKRGYLLYGPPGTGKSTMIAAMANYLNYDIYDIELTSVFRNSDFRSLSVATTGKSITVIEDIDCSFDDSIGERSNKGRSTPSSYDNDSAVTFSGLLNKRRSTLSSYNDDRSAVTLSGLLNFIDGVWSAQSGERIIVFTTNFPDKLDPSLIRSGRMDMHIEMSYCCFEAFETLARNYLGVGAHPLFQRVKELLQVVEITPADVCECLLWSQADVPGSDRGVETCLVRLIDKLLEKKAQGERQG
ncbi:unnamed protein product [Urochloa humidicola]